MGLGLGLGLGLARPVLGHEEAALYGGGGAGEASPLEGLLDARALVELLDQPHLQG